MTELRIVRSRRKTLALQVLPTGEIVARAPLRLPERDIHAFAEQHAAWPAPERGAGPHSGRAS